MDRSAYQDAVRLLARRELSEHQLRQRLARRGHAAGEIDAAVARLKEDRSLDDDRVAAVIARTHALGRRRGARRVRQQIEQAGISSAVAKQAVDNLFEGVDQDELIDAALARRLRGAALPAEAAGLARLYRYLLAQGFEPERVRACLDRRARSGVDDENPT